MLRSRNFCGILDVEGMLLEALERDMVLVGPSSVEYLKVCWFSNTIALGGNRQRQPSHILNM